MRIAVMGAGGMGGWLGAKLAASGNEVHFIARGEHLKALKKKGLKIKGEVSFEIDKVNATDNPEEIGVVDVVFFCVKLYDTESAAKAILPVIGPETFVLTVQNGVESCENIEKIIGEGKVIPGAAYFPSNITAPGEITSVGRIKGKPHIAFGEKNSEKSERVKNFAKVCINAGIDTDIFDDTMVKIWEKFCLIAGLSSSTAVTRQSVGWVRNDPDARLMLEGAIKEAASVGRKLGVALDEKLEADTLAFIDNSPENGKASLLVDLESKKKLELDGLSGSVVRLGRKKGVETPVHSTVYAALKPFINGK